MKFHCESVPAWIQQCSLHKRLRGGANDRDTQIVLLRRTVCARVRRLANESLLSSSLGATVRERAIDALEACANTLS